MSVRGSLKITDYRLLGELPDPFVTENGHRITSPEEWPARRKEIYKTAVELQYGTMPPLPEFLTVEQIYEKPRMKAYEIVTGTRACPVQFRLQIRLPEGEGPFPVIVYGDRCWLYSENEEWVQTALSKGIAWAMFDRTELAHDIQYEGRAKGALYRTYPEESFGAIGAWAWGYSRVVDALYQLDVPLDLDWIAFSGHSRGAKTVALAGALDERARIVNPNETDAGACACYRIHMKGSYENGPEKPSETLHDLLSRFDFWMGPELMKYADAEEKLPFDCHYLKAMIAPRILFVSEAAGDIWGNPPGTYFTTMAAKEVYRFLGAENHLYWYFRPGFHAHAIEDVRHLVNLIRHEKYGEELLPDYEEIPFETPETPYSWSAPAPDGDEK